MRFLDKKRPLAGRLGILSGAFHPPTRAHLALAQTALDTFQTDHVLFVLPQDFPHKSYSGVPLQQRLEMLQTATSSHPRLSIAVTEGGLFLHIALECRRALGPQVPLRFLCGSDAAERILAWDYTGHPPIEEQLELYELLVVPRDGHFAPPPHLAPRIAILPTAPECRGVSSSEVRDRIAKGEDWISLVPHSIVDQVRRLYSPHS